MAFLFDIDRVIELYYNSEASKALTIIIESERKLQFEKSLRFVLRKVLEDERFKDVREIAYLLATGAKESAYSLERWESDYQCKYRDSKGVLRNLTGIKYGPEGPCQEALNYYRSTKGGKKNYYDPQHSPGYKDLINKNGEITDKRGLPYFGRGFIQITLAENYDKFGKKINIDLLNDPEKIFIPINSYNVAVEYCIARGVFSSVLKGDLQSARKRVGNVKDAPFINIQYNTWLKILKQAIQEFKVFADGLFTTPETKVTVINAETNIPVEEVIIKKIEYIPPTEEEIEGLIAPIPKIIYVPPTEEEMIELENSIPPPPEPSN